MLSGRFSPLLALRGAALLLLALVSGVSTHAQTELRAEIDGQSYPVRGTFAGRPAYVKEGRPQPLPIDAPLRLQPVANYELTLVELNTRYDVRRMALPEWRGLGESGVLVQWRAEIVVPRRMANLFLVSVWEVDGAVQKVDLQLVPMVSPERPYIRESRFQRPAAEARGLLRLKVFGDAAELRPTGGRPPTPLERLSAAARDGNAEAVEEIIKTTPALAKEAGPGGETALLLAARNGREAVVDRLLAAGAPPESVSLGGLTPLAGAAWHGHTAVVQRLLAAGADPKNAPGGQPTALQRAVTALDRAAAEELLKAGAPWSLSPEERARALVQGVERGSPRFVEWLLERGAEPNRRGDGRLPMLAAAARGDVALFDRLLAAGGRLDVRSDTGVTALIEAARHGHRELLGRLLAREGIERDARDKAGFTALRHAVEARDPAVVEILLQAGADAGAADADGSTPLMAAVALRRVDLAEPLLRRGAGWNFSARDSDRLLTLAVAEGMTGVIGALLERGLDPARPLFADWNLAGLAEYYEQGGIGLLLAARNSPPPLRPPALKSDEFDQTLIPSRTARPEFPQAVAHRFNEGTASVEFLLDPEGRPVAPKAVSARHPAFGEAAADAVLRWQFPPPTRQGRGNWVRLRLPFAFKLPALDESAVFDAGDVDEPPALVRRAPPRGLSSPVSATVRLVIDEAGAVLKPQVLTLNEEGAKEAVCEALSAWSFTPPQRHGRRVKVRLEMPVEWAAPR